MSGEQAEGDPQVVALLEIIRQSEKKEDKPNA